MSKHAPRFIGLLAAHFAEKDQGRVVRLRRLLQSVAGQTHRVPLLVSWSAEESESDRTLRSGGACTTVAAQAGAILHEFALAGVVHVMPRLTGKRAQFQHYERLSKVLQRHVHQKEYEPMIVFTDDDDVWHPQRAEEYLQAASEQPKARVLASRVHVSPGFSPRLPETATASDITRLLAEGQFRLAVHDEHTQPGLFGTATGEYFDVAVASSVLAEFFERHNDALIANKFADIRFRTFVQKWRDGVHRFLPRDASGQRLRSTASENTPRTIRWMYFYDRPTEPYTTPPSEEDLQYLCDDLPDIERIAGMRQTLDCVLFQLAPTEGSLRITASDFMERFYGLLLNKNPGAMRMALDRCRIHGVEVDGISL